MSISCRQPTISGSSLRVSEPGAPFGHNATAAGCGDSVGGVEGMAGPPAWVLACNTLWAGMAGRTVWAAANEADASREETNNKERNMGVGGKPIIVAEDDRPVNPGGGGDPTLLIETRLRQFKRV